MSTMSGRPANDDDRTSRDKRRAPIDLEHPRPIRDVIRDLNARLKSEIEQSGEDGFGWPYYLDPDQQIMPRAWRWIACYAVKGGSEGYWVHIDLIMADGDIRQNIGLTKVWSWTAALALSNAATRILHDH
jgi:hypothetical protein